MHNNICILIYNRGLIFPASLSRKTLNSGTGLCNQLFQLIVGIHCSDFNTSVLYCDYFSKDFITGDMIKLSEILNFNEMERLYGIKLRDLTDLVGPAVANKIFPNFGGMWSVYREDKNSFIDISQKFIFSNKYESVAKAIIQEKGLHNSKVNLVHLRIDKDVKNHIISNADNQTFETYENNFKKAIVDHCDPSLDLVLLMEDVDHPMVTELKKSYNILYFDKTCVTNAYNKLFSDNDLNGREMYALIDLLIGKNLNVNTFVCADGTIFSSSFSVLLKYLNTYKTIVTV